MIQLELSTEEAQHLKAEVKTRLTALEDEIAHTDSTEFKDLLKRRRETVCKFLGKLPETASVAA